MQETSDGKSNLPVTLDRDVSITRYYIYVLFSLKDQKLYIGFTTNLKIRLTEHAKGHVRTTKLRRPLKLIYYEYLLDENDARVRERFLKSGFGRNQLKLALKNTLSKLGYKYLPSSSNQC